MSKENPDEEKDIRGEYASEEERMAEEQAVAAEDPETEEEHGAEAVDGETPEMEDVDGAGEEPAHASALPYVSGAVPPRHLLQGMYQNWFLEYASYVILERAVPHLEDGLKPVQRRILHTMKTLDDGRFNKVANIVGATMQYHPHGDASINDALVQLGQKDLLVETQGNWGNKIGRAHV